MKLKRLFPLLLLFSIVLVSCDPEEPEIPEEPEVITTLIYTLTPDDGSEVKTFSFEDLDGDAGNAPVISEATLNANTTYSTLVTLSNNSVTPSEDITAEVEEEGAEHQLFYEWSLSDITTTYTDADEGNLPIGLTTEVITGAAGDGTVTITLRHKPNKSADGVASGDITNAGGETDIAVTFNVTVE